jgi:putative transposase
LQPVPPTGRETGIDMGLTVFLVTADGLVVANPRHSHMAEQALKNADRRVARRQQGSHRHRKAIALRASKHQQVKRQRQDQHHKIALLPVRDDDTRHLDVLPVAHMVRHRQLSKRIGDAGWAQLRTVLAYTAGCAGKRAAAIPA